MTSGDSFVSAGGGASTARVRSSVVDDAGGKGRTEVNDLPQDGAQLKLAALPRHQEQRPAQLHLELLHLVLAEVSPLLPLLHVDHGALDVEPRREERPPLLEGRALLLDAGPPPGEAEQVG